MHVLFPKRRDTEARRVVKENIEKIPGAFLSIIDSILKVYLKAAQREMSDTHRLQIAHMIRVL